MKKIFHNLIAVIAIGALSSCNLDTQPTDSVDAGSVFSTTGDAEKVLNGSWRYLMETWNSYANPGFGAMLRAGDAMGSDCVLNTKYGFSAHYALSAIYTKGGTNTLSWRLAYYTIRDCNAVISHIDEVTGSQDDKNRIKGQALATRGWMYMHLASHYSFAIDKNPDAVCVPIYETETTQESASSGTPAASVSEVYDRAILDMENALDLIPQNYSRDSKHKIDRHVVLGLLSRACLYARQWEKARDYSRLALDMSDYLMSESEFKSGFNDSSNSEWIFAHPQTNEQNNPSYQFYYLDTTTPGSYYFSFNVDPWFREKYENGDYRRDLIYWAPDPNADPSSAGYVWMRNAKFKFRDIANMIADIVLMRNAEIYLINAEALARLNDDAGAEMLNRLRVTRGASPVTTSGNDLIEDILMERRRELWGEGFSLVDIIRNRKSVERREWPQGKYLYTWQENGETKSREIPMQGHRITRFPDGSEFTPDSKYYLFRITDAEERANQLIYSKYPKLDIYN